MTDDKGSTAEIRERRRELAQQLREAAARGAMRKLLDEAVNELEEEPVGRDPDAANEPEAIARESLTGLRRSLSALAERLQTAVTSPGTDPEYILTLTKAARSLIRSLRKLTHMRDFD